MKTNKFTCYDRIPMKMSSIEILDSIKKPQAKKNIGEWNNNIKSTETESRKIDAKA